MTGVTYCHPGSYCDMDFFVYIVVQVIMFWNTENTIRCTTNGSTKELRIMLYFHEIKNDLTETLASASLTMYSFIENCLISEYVCFI